MSLLYEIQPAAPSLADSSRITSLPILLLNVHSRCNCRCVMCDIWKRTENKEMQAADLDRHHASMRNLGVKHVVLTGGEPLLHSDLHAFCRFFREHKIRLTLLTTGLLLHKRAKDVATLFDDVILSLDGPAAVHDEIRRIPGAFSLIQKGVASVRSVNPEMNISCRTTVQKANHEYLCDTVSAAKLLTLSSISFLPADLSSEAFNRPQTWEPERRNEISLTEPQISALEEEIGRLIRTHADAIQQRYILESVPKLWRLANRFREHLGHAQPLAPQCNAPWVSIVVDVDGTVRPCFFQPAIGDLKRTTLEEALNSTAARSFRQSLDVAKNSICRRCVCSLNYRSDLPAIKA